MSDADDDTVVSPRRSPPDTGDTVVSRRRGNRPIDSAVADTELRPRAARTTDASVPGFGRETAPEAPTEDSGVEDDAVEDEPVDDTVRRLPAGRRGASSPDAATLRAPTPVRAPQPVIVARRAPVADSGARRVRESVDPRSVDRATHARARRRIGWLVIACAAAAAAAASLLVLLPL